MISTGRGGGAAVTSSTTAAASVKHSTAALTQLAGDESGITAALTQVSSESLVISFVVFRTCRCNVHVINSYQNPHYFFHAFIVEFCWGGLIIFDSSSPFYFLLIEFYCTFLISYKILPYYIY